MVNSARSRAERLDTLPADKRALLTMLVAERAATARAALADSIAVLGGAGAGADPILLIHPIGGGVFCYAELSRALPDDRPVWAVAADALMGKDTTVTVERLAAHYLDQVRAAGCTPAVLVGWSFGGLIAYEMARVLAATMRRTPPVVLLDTMSWPPDIPAWDAATTTREFVRDLLRSAGTRYDERYLDAVDWHRPAPAALAGAQAQLRGRGMELGFELTELVDRHRMYTNATRAMQRYRPRPHTGPVTLIHALGSDVRPDEWRAVVRGPLSVSAVAGDHYAVVRGGAATGRAATAIAAAAGYATGRNAEYADHDERQARP